jgi:hypothetical protein
MLMCTMPLKLLSSFVALISLKEKKGCWQIDVDPSKAPLRMPTNVFDELLGEGELGSFQI